MRKDIWKNLGATSTLRIYVLYNNAQIFEHKIPFFNLLSPHLRNNETDKSALKCQTITSDTKKY